MSSVGLVSDSRVDSFAKLDLNISLSLDDVSNLHPPKVVNPMVGYVVSLVVSLDIKNFPHSGRRRAAKVIKKVMDLVLLVVSADIKLKDIILTNELTLVGRFDGRKCSATG